MSMITTNGFIIENIQQFLPTFVSDPLLVGWMFHFANGEGIDRQQFSRIKTIKVSELRLTPQTTTGTYTLTLSELPIGEGNAAAITPYKHNQYEEPENKTGEKYDSQVTGTGSQFISSADDSTVDNLNIEDLDGYRCWSDASFIRATDLRLLSSFLDTAEYDDIFFSGAEVNNKNMNNARLRIEQFWLEIFGKCIAEESSNSPRGEGLNIVDGRTYINTSTSFALKAEPVYMGSGDIDDNAVINGFIPAAFTMVGCPKYWDVMRAINEEVKNITGDTAIQFTDYTEADGLSFSDVVDAVENQSIPVSNATTFANFLRWLADQIDALFLGTN